MISYEPIYMSASDRRNYLNAEIGAAEDQCRDYGDKEALEKAICNHYLKFMAFTKYWKIDPQAILNDQQE